MPERAAGHGDAAGQVCAGSGLAGQRVAWGRGGQRVRRADGRSPPTAALWHFLGTGRGWEPSGGRGGGARSPACLFTAGEAALYFARVAWCFGTAGGGGAQGNKSVAGREGGWGEEQSPSRSSCQTHGPASGPSPCSGQPGWPGPCPPHPRAALLWRPRLCGSALSCQLPQGGSDDRAGR